MTTALLRILPVGLLGLALGLPLGCEAQAPSEEVLNPRSEWFREAHPEVATLLEAFEAAQGILFGALLDEGDAVRATGGDIPTFGFEFDTFDRLNFFLEDVAGGAAEIDPAEVQAGWAVLGARGAEIVARTHALHREVMAIWADPAVMDRAAAVEEAVDRYLARPEVALPDRPKDMTILYDHPYTFGFQTGYPDLNGLVWATHWLSRAAFEPLLLSSDPDQRATGFETVTARFWSKLSYGEPPEAFPTELPLAPTITPGLVARSPRAATIFDNLSMMNDVLADILVHPEVTDVREALDTAIAQFVDPNYRIVQRNDWILMALRHSIFNQGGPALGVMTQSERNNSGHAQHLQSLGRQVLPGMPGG